MTRVRLMPPNEDIIFGTLIQRAVGIARAYQPAIGVYCFVPEKGVKIGTAVPTLTVDNSLSTGTGNRVQWARDPATVGCKPGELAVVTLTADGKGGLKLTTTVGFGLVVS